MIRLPDDYWSRTDIYDRAAWIGVIVAMAILGWMAL